MGRVAAAPTDDLPPLAVLLLHLGACTDALLWCGRRPITEAALGAVPRSDWRDWIATALHVRWGATWEHWLAAARKTLSGYGYGYGYGSGYGYGYGDGYGYGYGYGYGDGYGYGSGYGYGDGSGYGDGDGYDIVVEAQ